MKQLRVQFRVGLALLAVLTLLFWTIPYFMEDHREPVELVWLMHSDAQDISALDLAPEKIAELAQTTAFHCGAKDLDIYLDVNGLQSVYWKEPLDSKIEDCLRGSASKNLKLVRDLQYGTAPQPPYSKALIL